MMLRIHFTPDDLLRTRVLASPDPLWESLLSVFRIHDRSAVHRPWLQRIGTNAGVLGDRVQAGIRLFDVLAPRGPYFPDFLTPAEGVHGLEAGLDAFCRTPRGRFHDELVQLGRNVQLPAWVRLLAEGDRETVEQVRTTVRGYHEAAVAPHVDIIDESVAADYAYRAQSLRLGGLEGLFDSLRPLIRWRPPVLEVDYSVDRELHLRGRGLCLVPSYFCERLPISLVNPDLPPVLVYPIDQQFKWRTEPSARPLDALIGRTRGAVLNAVGNGSTTTEIARRLGASLASVSRHAATLRAAGLISSHRRDTAVLHSLTSLGEAVLGRRPAH